MAWPDVRRYALAFPAVAAAVLVARALDPYIAPHISGPYFLAVMLVAAYAGAGPGLVATVLASFAIMWFDLGTTYRFDLGLDDLIRLAVFTVTGLVISSISAARRAAERELRIALEDLAAVDRSKDEFIATVSHELRTPLTSILGWLKILRVDDLDAETRELALESIEQSAKTQAMLVSDMLDASRIVLGKLHVEREPLFVRDVVRDAVAVITPAAEVKKTTVDVKGLDDTAVVCGDRERLKQVVWNFLSNSVKFTPDGGTIRVRVLHDDYDAIVEVSDDGEGMSADLLRHAFDRFTQGTESVRKGGLGLGLSIVSHIVELHGGSVSAYSAGANRGATFTARIPLLRDAEQRRQVRPLPETTSRAGDRDLRPTQTMGTRRAASRVGRNTMTKCAHDPCHCQGNEVQADGYCSPSCREGKAENGRCACGHPDCR
jgi:signal transduction histidine kinase